MQTARRCFKIKPFKSGLRTKMVGTRLKQARVIQTGACTRAKSVTRVSALSRASHSHSRRAPATQGSKMVAACDRNLCFTILASLAYAQHFQIKH